MLAHNFIVGLPFVFFTLLATVLRHPAFASKCVVNKWREWSECQGNCEFAQRVRNRDVIRPPFPERDEQTGEFFIRECPPLYETEPCTPSDCTDESPFAKIPSSLFKQLQSRPGEFKTSGSGGRSEEELAAATIGRAANNNNKTGGTESRRRAVQSSLPTKVKQEHQKGGRNKLAGIGIQRGKTTSTSSSGSNEHQEHGRLDCAHENKGCCRMINRVNCSNGSRPRQLIRWYRKKDEQFCRPYKYSFCEDPLFGGSVVFANENECVDACFSDVEKAVLPNFRVI